MNTGEFNKGDKVRLANNNELYSRYTDFIKRHKKYMLKWAYGSRPIVTHTFTILGIHKHVKKHVFDENNYCVAIQDDVTDQIFLTGDLALKKIKG